MAKQLAKISLTEFGKGISFSDFKKQYGFVFANKPKMETIEECYERLTGRKSSGNAVTTDNIKPAKDQPAKNGA